jgi:hypothetical protein
MDCAAAPGLRKMMTGTIPGKARFQKGKVRARRGSLKPNRGRFAAQKATTSWILRADCRTESSGARR